MGHAIFETDKVIVLSMAAFKNHSSIGFWNAALLSDPDGILSFTPNHGMGPLGKISSLKDLPKEKIIVKYLKEVASLEKNHTQATKKDKQTIEMP